MSSRSEGWGGLFRDRAKRAPYNVREALLSLAASSLNSIVHKPLIERLPRNAQHLSGESLVSFASREGVRNQLNLCFAQCVHFVAERSGPCRRTNLDDPFRDLRIPDNLRLAVSKQHLH